MEKIPFLNRLSPAAQRIVWVLVVILLLAIIILPFTPGQAPGSALGQAAPTAAPTAGQAEGEGSVLMMIIGAVVMIAPMVYIAWKSRGLKQPDIRSSCCLPVIDESKRPFKPEEEEEEEEKS